MRGYDVAYAEREIQMKRKSFAYALGMCMLPTELCISTYTEEKNIYTPNHKS